MDDPWDVKSVRQAGQYTSCMKLNGTPLLPPVLSKECRKEMQYYKLLAKEVEKRISILQPYVPDSDTESSEDKTDAPEILESEQSYDIIQKFCPNKQDHEFPTSDVCALSDPNVTTESNFVLDFSFSINQTGRNVLETLKGKSPCLCLPADLPERDYNCMKTKDLILEVEEKNNRKKEVEIVENIVKFNISMDKDELSNPFPDSILSSRHPSLGTKSFTGSLNDLHTESVKSSQIAKKLVRQRSYTLLKPSPQLLAHLEVQSLNTGVEMSCISMSESLSNLSSPNKKRRSWDLESAKVKWSSMAMELKQKRLPKSSNNTGTKVKLVAKKPVQSIYTPSRPKFVAQDKCKRASTPVKSSPKSEPLPKRRPSPIRNIPSNVTLVKGPASPKPANQKKEPPAAKSPPHVVSESEDPAAKVRELYDKIQKQQLAQMATLVEKQKREQILLQQVFEEQNNLLYKQLKTIVPKASIEAKEAWGDKSLEVERGPVSLSQLINHKSPEINEDLPLSSTLTETNTYIDRCDDVLKKSRVITSSIKTPKATRNGMKTSSPIIYDGSRTRTHSPAGNTSRKLVYDSSASSERECEPIFTDRTNDTMADLNVTFPTDKSDECPSYCQNSTVQSLCGKEVTVIHASPSPGDTLRCSSTDSAINCMEQTIHNSINSCYARRPNAMPDCQPTHEQRAAASKIVAWCRGHLVRRLMRTERVAGTVQTIRDALLCALQLHQDRAGIRGADVDLHRRLIQQITAACYALHDTFIASSPAERCALIAADRARRRSLAARPPLRPPRHTDL